MPKTIFLSTGHYVPSRVVTNQDLTKFMDTSHEWILQRTGIETRHYVDFEHTPMGTSDLACKAALQALQKAQLSPEQIDLIVYATLSPDRHFPGDGVLLQAKLNIPSGVPALDIRNQCSGFLYGLAVADAFIRNQTYQHVLLVGAEVHSTGLDFSNRGRDVTVLFGDGAAAAVLGATDEADQGLMSVHLHADGRFADELSCNIPSSAKMPRITADDLKNGDEFPKMNGRQVFKHAIRRLPEVILEVLQKHDLTVEQVDLFVMHQANLRICEAVQQSLNIQDHQIFNNIQKYGNTTACSIPLALDEAQQTGRLKRGDTVCLAAFGAGFTWAAAVLKW